MTSTLTSEKILEVKNLNLVYLVPVKRRNNFRDVFTAFTQNPLDVLIPQTDRLHIAQNLSFKIEKGERVGLLGINGVGKTSLCRCIAGLFTPTSGTIKRHVPVRGIFNTGMGIQPELTGRENAELLAHFIFPECDDVKDLVNEAVEFSELGHFADIPYKLYSNGMQTRLSLSLVSARPAGLLILDEVFDGADMFFREKVTTRVTRLMEKSGAVLFVSHIPDQVKRVCTRTIVLHRGQIVFDGDPVEGLKFYENSGPSSRLTPESVSESIQI